MTSIRDLSGPDSPPEPSDPPAPDTTLVIVLGASQYPRTSLKSSKAFKSAAETICLYFLSNYGFGLPLENLLYFFDSPYDPNTLDDQITTGVLTRIQQLQTIGTAPRDLVVYYVGHGSFDEHRRYVLALQSTRDENQSVSSLRVEALMTTLNQVTKSLRKFVIIDACFAGESVIYSQAKIDDAVRQQFKRLPQKGTVFLCSSSRDFTSEFLPDESNTVFTKALAECLSEGAEGFPAKLSFEYLHQLIEEKLLQGSTDFIRPEIHATWQPEGNIAKIGFFPNGPWRIARSLAEREYTQKKEAYLAYLRYQRDEQIRRAQNIAAEKEEHAGEVRRQLHAESEREHTRKTQKLKHYGSDDEKKFREEAEHVQHRDLNQDLLLEWLRWKSSQNTIHASALRQLAREHQQNASRYDYQASNIWDMVKTARKNGSDQTADLLNQQWHELLDSKKDEQKKATALGDEAEDCDTESRFYAQKANDTPYLTRQAMRARRHTQSLDEAISSQVRFVAKQAQWLRKIKRFVQACVTLTRRALIGAMILVILGLMSRCDELVNST
jgi:hypothetical protein